MEHLEHGNIPRGTKASHVPFRKTRWNISEHMLDLHKQVCYMLDLHKQVCYNGISSGDSAGRSS